MFCWSLSHTCLRYLFGAIFYLTSSTIYVFTGGSFIYWAFRAYSIYMKVLSIINFTITVLNLVAATLYFMKKWQRYCEWQIENNQQVGPSVSDIESHGPQTPYQSISYILKNLKCCCRWKRNPDGYPVNSLTEPIYEQEMYYQPTGDDRQYEPARYSDGQKYVQIF